MKAVDVDALLADNKLTLTLKGKTYVVEDIPLPSFIAATAEDDGKSRNPEALHKQLSTILGCPQEELKGVGLKASSIAISAVREWIMQDVDEDTEPVDRFDDKTGKPLKGGGAKPSKNP